MKKLTLFAFASIILFGCSNSDKVEISVEEFRDYRKLKGDTLHHKTPKRIIVYHEGWNQEVEISPGSDGCEYASSEGGTNSFWQIHYPQCSNPIHKDTCKCK